MLLIRSMLFRLKRSVNKRLGINTFTNQNPVYSKFQIGDYTYGFPNVRVFTKNARLVIGNYCSIAQGVKILLGGQHNLKSITTYPFPHTTQSETNYSAQDQVEIGSDVWIGENALLLSGVKIGHGVVIGAGSVVTKDLPPYSICAGVPCRPIKYRFDDATISKLLEIEWWNWSKEHVEKIQGVLLGSDCSMLISYSSHMKKNEQ